MPRRLRAVTNTSILFQTPLAGLGDMSTTELGGRRWIALNVREALNVNRRGEYHYDAQASVITYARRQQLNKGEELEPPLVGVWPRLPTLLSIGNASNLTFQGIQFSHTSVGPDPANISYGPAAYGAVEMAGGADISFDS
eukprot:SAG31_NODE_10698_length_1108_cov_1.504460_2_plen_140_part_00